MLLTTSCHSPYCHQNHGRVSFLYVLQLPPRLYLVYVHVHDHVLCYKDRTLQALAKYGGKNSTTLMRSKAEKVHLLKKDVRKARRRKKNKRTSDDKATAGDGVGGGCVTGVQTKLSENGFSFGLKGLGAKFLKKGASKYPKEKGKGVEINRQEARNPAAAGGRSTSRGKENGLGDLGRRGSRANGGTGNNHALEGTPEIV